MAIVAKKLQETKVSSISELKELFQGAEDFVFADYRGLTVEQITQLRSQLREKNAQFKVVKNHFARIAFEQLAAPDISNMLIGPSAIAISKQDTNEVAKILFEFIREVPVLKIKGGLLGKDIYDAAQIEAFSKLPGRKELISMLMSVMNAPARNLAAALNDINSRLVRTVKAIGDKKSETNA